MLRPPSARLLIPKHHRHSSSSSSSLSSSNNPDVVVNIPKANVYPFGAVQPVVRDLEWKVHNDEAWAIVGSGSAKINIFRTLLGQLRISPSPPAPGGLFPFLSSQSRDPYTAISLVSSLPGGAAGAGAPGSGFYDFSARYGAVRDHADRITLRQSMFPETIPPDPKLVYLSPEERNRTKMFAQQGKLKRFETLVEKVGLEAVLDLPVMALSNGQMRRARIVRAVLRDPALLLLDEPLTGVDAQTRPILLSLLHTLHTSHSPRLILGLRTHDGLPDWITHLLHVKDDRVVVGERDKVVRMIGRESVGNSSFVEELKRKEIPPHPVVHAKPKSAGEVLVDMKNVNVKYGSRTVLKNINWQIRRGERWHLKGSNGSGKTTLLSLLTGSHPQSYTQSPPIQLFSLQRPTIPTPYLQSLIGHFSPELFRAFPGRKGGRKNMTVWEAVASGFDGVFYVPPSSSRSRSRSRSREEVGEGVMRKITEEERNWRVGRVWEVFRALSPSLSSGASVEEFKDKAFSNLTTDEQRVVLLMRALVGRQGLVLLDEVLGGIGGEEMGRDVRKYLRGGEGVGEDQAVVVVTHWEEEVPWSEEEGLKRFVLEEGGVGRVA